MYFSNREFSTDYDAAWDKLEDAAQARFAAKCDDPGSDISDCVTDEWMVKKNFFFLESIDLLLTRNRMIGDVLKIRDAIDSGDLASAREICNEVNNAMKEAAQ